VGQGEVGARLRCVDVNGVCVRCVRVCGVWTPSQLRSFVDNSCSARRWLLLGGGTGPRSDSRPRSDSEQTRRGEGEGGKQTSETRVNQRCHRDGEESGAK
jgi:hypothetical protein